MIILGAIAVILGIITATLVMRRVTRAANDLFHQKELAEITLHSIGDAVITTDRDGNIDHINPVAEEMTGWSAERAHGAPLKWIFHALDETTREHLALMPAAPLADNPQHLDIRHAVLLRQDGQEFLIEGSRAPIRNAQKETIGSVLVFRDVSKARALARQLSWQASHDELTGLTNRRAFELLLQQYIDHARSGEQRYALLYIDLDNFKIVNDTCGHESGDELLRQLAGVLGNRLRESDTLARLGGDEFGVLLEGCSVDSALDIANDLLECIQEFRFAWDTRMFSIGVSIGLVAIDADTADLMGVLSAADHACYTAKDMGRNRIHLFQQDDREVARRQGEMRWVAKINSALSEDRFRLYYQNMLPRVAHGPAPAHREILLRMLDENGDIVSPMAFIPAAERYGLMPAIDRWVIGTLFAMLGTQQRAKNPAVRDPRKEYPPMYAINLSGTSLNDDGFLAFVQEQIQCHGIAANTLCFEITETAAIINLKRASYFIQELKHAGCRFALDDFGSGMSSFGYLKALPVDYLKIDGSFIVDMLRDPADYAMVDAINRIGHILGIQTVAEWVENTATEEMLKNLGVDFLQGNSIHPPEPFTVPVENTCSEPLLLQDSLPGVAFQ
jgi:diguanylate cyclase (GGDEF)-like protein/PAS domain S-box-containing protein